MCMSAQHEDADMSDCAVCGSDETTHGITVVERSESTDGDNIYYESDVSISVFFPVTDKVTDARLCSECYETEAFLN